MRYRFMSVCFALFLLKFRIESLYSFNTRGQRFHQEVCGKLSAFNGFADITNRLAKKFRSEEKEKEKSESELLVDYVNYKPWRAAKIKNLPICYRPWKDSYLERVRREDDDTIYLYSIPSFKPSWDSTRINDLWQFPWLWTKLKSERLAYLHKQFYPDCEALTAQEHIEMDCFFSEFDMPVRWGLLRLKEMDVLNVAALWIAFLTDFTAIPPTDLGLRPDGTLRTCPVQFHNCISSSSDPLDSDHYAPPFKWSRSKSPQQALEEVKSIYFNYPKRGLRWTNGWIDRGGWKPQLFGDTYFYAQAESLAFHYADDIELSMDFKKREVQYRSSTRIGQHDWDVERLRYNQFVRMLEANGGWEVRPLDRLYYLSRTPYRWTQFALDTAAVSVERGVSELYQYVKDVDVNSADSELTQNIATAKVKLLKIYDDLQPLIQPVVSAVEDLETNIRLDPRVAAVVHSLGEAYELLDSQFKEAVSDPQLKVLLDRVTDLVHSFDEGATSLKPTISEKVALEAPTQLSQEVDNGFVPSVSSEQIENAELVPSYPKTSLSPPDLNTVRPSTYSGKSETAVVIDRDTMLNSYLNKKPISNPNPTITDTTTGSPNLIARDPTRVTVVDTRTDGSENQNPTTGPVTDSIDADADENPNLNRSPSPDSITISLRTDRDDDRTVQKPWMKASSKKPLSNNNAVEKIVGNLGDGNNDDDDYAMYVVGKKYKSISRWSVSSDVAQVVARKKIVMS